MEEDDSDWRHRIPKDQLDTFIKEHNDFLDFIERSFRSKSDIRKLDDPDKETKN